MESIKKAQSLVEITQEVTGENKSEKVLSDSAALFRGLFESAPEAITIGDCDNGMFIEANSNAVNLFGYTLEELLKKQPHELSPEFQLDGRPSGEKAGEMIGRAMSGEKVIFEWVHQDAKGNPIDCEVRLTRLDIPGRNLVRGSMIDIGEKKLAEKKLQDANRLYAFISDVNQSIVQISDEQKLLDKICDIAIKIGQFKMAWIGMLDTDRKLNMVSVHGDPLGIKRIMKHSGLHTDDPIMKDIIVGKVLRTGKYEYTNDMQCNPAYELWRDEFIAQGIHASIALPITRGGVVVGVLSLQAGSKDFFDESEIKLLEEATGDISFALDNFDKERRRHQAEEKVLRSEERLKQAQALAHLGSWELDIGTGITLWSEESCRIYGIDPADNIISFADWASYIHPDDVERVMKLVEEQRESLSEIAFDHRIVRKDGSIRHLHAESKFEFDHDGQPISMYGISHDITEKKVAEKQKEFDKSNLDALINNTNDYMWSVDRDFKLITYNQPLYDIIHQAIGRELMQGADMTSYAFSPEQANTYKRFYERAFAGESFTEIEKNTLPVEVWSEISFCPIWDGNKIIGAACHSRDITERKKAALKIEESEKKFRHLFYNNPMPLWILDPKTLKILDVNNASVDIYGYSREEFLSMSALDIRPHEERERFRQLDHTYTGLRNTGIWVHLKKDKTPIDVEVSSGGIVYEGIQARLVLVNNVTERIKAESEIKELNENLENRVQQRTSELSEANKALEAFSYSVSHDLRAPVRSMVGFAKIIKQDYGAAMAPEEKELFGYIEDSGKRMSAIIDDLLKLAQYGNDKLTREPVDMAALINGVWQNIGRTNPHHTLLEMSELPEVDVDMGMMQQVVVNLLTNAIKYSSKTKDPVVKIWCESGDEFYTFYFKDNGAGFDMKNYDRLFGAFQRLHSMNEFEGTGVGLTLVKRIIEKHGGTIAAEAEVNKGATFYFTLPRNN